MRDGCVGIAWGKRLYVLLQRRCPLAPRLYRQQAACERGFLITTGLKCNRSLRIEDESQPAGWRWQRLDAYAASLSAEDFTQLFWPRDEDAEPVYVHVVSTRVRKLYVCQ